jgi:hypothetical protein
MLAFARVTYFHEDQYFRQSWLWLLIAVPIVVTIVSLAATPRMSITAIVITLAVGGLITALFALARLETEVRSNGIYVHFHGLWPTRRIALDDVDSYEARRYTMWESGGWGVHFTMTGIAYNVSGNDGVIIQLKKGKGGRVLIGTQRPQEFVAAIAKAMAAR